MKTLTFKDFCTVIEDKALKPVPGCKWCHVRDYRKEYDKFQSSDEKKAYRAELNRYNRKNRKPEHEGMDASHINGKIVGYEDASVNRGRAEKSRLKGSKRKPREIEEVLKRDDSQSGIKGFKNKGTASKAGKIAGKNKSDDAMRKHNDAMIDAALKQDKKAFDKSAKTVAKLFHKMYGQTMKIQTMWSVKKAKAMKDGSFWKMPISQRNKL